MRDKANGLRSVVDVRGTWEGKKRVTRMQKFLPSQWQGVEQ
jgi:hypothetical protein